MFKIQERYYWKYLTKEGMLKNPSDVIWGWFTSKNLPCPEDTTKAFWAKELGIDL